MPRAAEKPVKMRALCSRDVRTFGHVLALAVPRAMAARSRNATRSAPNVEALEGFAGFIDTQFPAATASMLSAR
jgi:hypothetical protein